MVISGAICHLILNDSGKVITTIPFNLIAFDLVVLANGKVNPFRLVLCS
jgi:hypothetical protein